MTMSVDAWTFRDLLADPTAAETMSAVSGCPLIIVEVDSAAAGSQLAGVEATAVPAVIVVIARDPHWLAARTPAAADIVLTEADDTARKPLIRPAGGVDAGLAALGAALTANPVAGTALALLLRMSAGLQVSAALVAESASYSALQAGAEFLRWRAQRRPRPPEPGTERVRIERSENGLRIILARPARRNAVDWRMRDALACALADALADPGAHIVLDGDGPDFCAGGDLDEFGSRPDPAQAHLIRLTRSPAMLLHRLGSRTTVLLHGACLGAGIELPAFAARVVAAEDARMGLPEIGLGLIPGSGGTVSLPRRIGRWRTAFLGLTGHTVDAREAVRWGLVDAIGPMTGGSR